MDITSQKKHDWWAPVWKGLVLDREGKHYRQMGSALWLLLYLILCADRQGGTLRRKLPLISQEMGVGARTIREWLSLLRRAGYIYTQNDGRCLLIGIKRWKTFPQRQFFASQSAIAAPNRVTKYCQSDEDENSPEIPNSSHQSAPVPEAYDRTTKNNNKKNDKESSFLNRLAFKGEGERESKKLLAVEISRALQDQENLPLYISYVKKYPLEIIRKAFQAAISTPKEKIKKTRGALFNYLVKYYANKQQITPNSSDQSGMEIPGDRDLQ